MAAAAAPCPGSFDASAPFPGSFDAAAPCIGSFDAAAPCPGSFDAPVDDAAPAGAFVPCLQLLIS